MGEEAAGVMAGRGAVVIVLGGNEGERRAETGAQIFRRERAATVLVTRTARECRELGAVLRREGVPEARIVLIPGAVDTVGNARDASRWLSRGPVGRVFVVSSDYHLPRVRYLFARRLSGFGVRVRYVGAPSELSGPERQRMRRLEALKLCFERMRRAFAQGGVRSPLDGP